jgi:hypothetical protein
MTFILTDHNRDRTKEFDTEAEAEEKKNDMISLGANPEDLEISTDGSNGTEESAGADTQEAKQTPQEATQLSEQAQEDIAVSKEQIENGDTVPVEKTDGYDLPDGGPSIDEDPLVWMPDEFTDTVDGTVTISRKGYEVLAHHYDVSGGTEMVVSPVETDMAYTVHKATVTDANGQEYSAYGEAHASDNGEENIVRMSDTRAYKRAVSRATGVGTIAIEELQNEL